MKTVSANSQARPTGVSIHQSPLGVPRYSLAMWQLLWETSPGAVAQLILDLAQQGDMASLDAFGQGLSLGQFRGIEQTRVIAATKPGHLKRLHKSDSALSRYRSSAGPEEQIGLYASSKPTQERTHATGDETPFECCIFDVLAQPLWSSTTRAAFGGSLLRLPYAATEEQLVYLRRMCRHLQGYAARLPVGHPDLLYKNFFFSSALLNANSAEVQSVLQDEIARTESRSPNIPIRLGGNSYIPEEDLKPMAWAALLGGNAASLTDLLTRSRDGGKIIAAGVHAWITDAGNSSDGLMQAGISMIVHELEHKTQDASGTMSNVFRTIMGALDTRDAQLLHRLLLEWSVERVYRATLCDSSDPRLSERISQFVQWFADLRPATHPHLQSWYQASFDEYANEGENHYHTIGVESVRKILTCGMSLGIPSLIDQFEGSFQHACNGYQSPRYQSLDDLLSQPEIFEALLIRAPYRELMYRMPRVIQILDRLEGLGIDIEEVNAYLLEGNGTQKSTHMNSGYGLLHQIANATPCQGQLSLMLELVDRGLDPDRRSASGKTVASILKRYGMDEDWKRLLASRRAYGAAHEVMKEIEAHVDTRAQQVRKSF